MLTRRLQKQVPRCRVPARTSNLWRDNLTGFFKPVPIPRSSSNGFKRTTPIRAYAKSMAFQGTGYGSFIRQYELALNQALQDQLNRKPQSPPFSS